MGYGLSRWLLEPFRAESAVIPVIGLRLPQVIGLALALVALWGLTRPRGSTDAGLSGPRDEDQPPLAT
jgi:hypothetical protein